MKKYTRNADNIASKIQDEIVMVNVTLGNYFSLNSVASSIWELLEQPRTLDDLCDHLIEEYDIDRESCIKEAQSFLDKLVEHKLIELK
jgi:Coenzyme PQQ synthesis protein D (PqqD)